MPWQKQANKRFIKGCQSGGASRAYDPNAQMIAELSATGTHTDQGLWQKSIPLLVETADILDLKVVRHSCSMQPFRPVIASLLAGAGWDWSYVRRRRWLWNYKHLPWLGWCLENIQMEEASVELADQWERHIQECTPVGGLPRPLHAALQDVWSQWQRPALTLTDFWIVF